MFCWHLFKREYICFYREHPQKHPDIKALERFMAAGLETIPEETDKTEDKNGSRTTLLSEASCKSAPNPPKDKKEDERTFGTDLAQTVTQ